jgi:hypothetical protein
MHNFIRRLITKPDLTKTDMLEKALLISIISIFSLFSFAGINQKNQPAYLKTGKLKVSENKRFLVFEDGTPFFYLGDTAWELFHRLSKPDTEKYLENRHKKGFTVIQAVVLAELDGLNTPNAEGELPLFANDPGKPNEKYFTHVDWVIKKAEEKGIYIGLLPTWGDKWNKKWGTGPEIFTPENARDYGKYLGTRYKNNPNIIWILGGDRPVENETHRKIITEMAAGLHEGDKGNHLITFHPTGGSGSAQIFHNESWLDFNMRQNGHSISYTERYNMTLNDYNMYPSKPVFDGEPVYEDHPINFKPDENGHSVAADVRRTLYWNLFSGAFGHTYGHHSVWQMWSPGKEPVNRPLLPWNEAIDQPGAGQMIFGRLLMESRPFLSRIPDNSIIIKNDVPTAVPGAGAYSFVATRDSEGTYLMVYVPVGRKFSIKTSVIKGEEIVVWWYNPRTGEATKAGKYKNPGEQSFISPTPGECTDWILVIDDASEKYKKPGSLK